MWRSFQEDFLGEKVFEGLEDVLALVEGLEVAFVVQEFPHFLEVFDGLLQHVFFVDSEVFDSFGPPHQRFRRGATGDRWIRFNHPNRFLFLLCDYLSHHILEQVIPLFEILIKMIRRRLFPSLILPHQLTSIIVPFLHMNLLTIRLFHGHHHPSLLVHPPQVLLGLLLDLEDVVVFLLLDLASAFFDLVEVGLEASKALFALDLLPSSTVLLLGVACSDVFLFFAVGQVESIPDVGTDLLLSEFSTLQKALDLLLFLDAQLNPSQSVFQQFFRDSLPRHFWHPVEVLRFKKMLSLELLIQGPSEQRLMDQLLKELGGTRRDQVHLSNQKIIIRNIPCYYYISLYEEMDHMRGAVLWQ